MMNGEMDGRGTITYKSGNKYEGEFRRDCKEGQGTYFFSDGRKHEGGWRNDKKQG